MIWLTRSGVIVTDKVIPVESREDKEIRERAEYYAKLHKAMYEAHKKQGFDHEDALYLCASADPD